MDELDFGFEPISPLDAPDLMGGYSGLWWISGGWALDLVGGTQTRPHTDLDIGVLRVDVPELFASLDFELHAAGGGRLTMMEGPDDLPPESNSIWARRRGQRTWAFELILNESDGPQWVYRRDPRIQIDLAEMTVQVEGVRCLRPEVQLLFKAKQMRERDIADFASHAPRLDPAGRTWLRETLRLAHPGHPWIDQL